MTVQKSKKAPSIVVFPLRKQWEEESVIRNPNFLQS